MTAKMKGQLYLGQELKQPAGPITLKRSAFYYLQSLGRVLQSGKKLGLPLLAALAAFAGGGAAQAAENGAPAAPSGELAVPLPAGGAMAVARFRPACRQLRGAAVIFPGFRRNSKTYRNAAEPLARQLCLLIYAPHFSARRFPPADYQHGGAGLSAAAPLLAAVRADAARANGGRPLPLLLIGHSAGAQYLSRLAAYAPPAPAPRRYILLSGGSYVFASARFAPPYGFGGLPAARLEAYLAAPISLMAGGADIKANAHLSQSPAARTQGANRLARAQNLWQSAAQQAAASRRVFNWNFAIIPGLGHSERALLASPALAAEVQKSLPAK